LIFVFFRDLKAENVLVANDLSIRLMDFGLSRLVDYSRVANMTAAIGNSTVLCSNPFYEQVRAFIWHRS